MHNEPQLHEVKVVCPSDDCPWLDLEDGYGNHLCRVNYDDEACDIIHGVASSICKAAGIEFTPLEGWK